MIMKSAVPPIPAVSHTSSLRGTGKVADDCVPWMACVVVRTVWVAWRDEVVVAIGVSPFCTLKERNTELIDEACPTCTATIVLPYRSSVCAQCTRRIFGLVVIGVMRLG